MLDSSKISDGIKAYADSSYPGSIFPVSEEDAINKLAEVIYNYALDVLPASTTTEAAKGVMTTNLAGLNTPGMAEGIIKTACYQFALTLATGMAGYVAVAPLEAALSFSDIDSNGKISTAEQCATMLANNIDTWFKTGTATTGGTTINWS